MTRSEKIEAAARALVERLTPEEFRLDAYTWDAHAALRAALSEEEGTPYNRCTVCGREGNPQDEEWTHLGCKSAPSPATPSEAAAWPCGEPNANMDRCVLHAGHPGGHRYKTTSGCPFCRGESPLCPPGFGCGGSGRATPRGQG